MLLKEIFEMARKKSLTEDKGPLADIDQMQEFAADRGLDIAGAYIVTDPKRIMPFTKTTEAAFAEIQKSPNKWKCFYIDQQEELSAWVPAECLKNAPKNIKSSFPGEASAQGFGGHYDPDEHNDMHREMVANIAALGGKISRAKLRDSEFALHIIKINNGEALVITSRDD